MGRFFLAFLGNYTVFTWYRWWWNKWFYFKVIIFVIKYICFIPNNIDSRLYSIFEKLLQLLLSTNIMKLKHWLVGTFNNACSQKSILRPRLWQFLSHFLRPWQTLFHFIHSEFIFHLHTCLSIYHNYGTYFWLDLFRPSRMWSKQVSTQNTANIYYVVSSVVQPKTCLHIAQSHTSLHQTPNTLPNANSVATQLI